MINSIMRDPKQESDTKTISMIDSLQNGSKARSSIFIKTKKEALLNTQLSILKDLTYTKHSSKPSHSIKNAMQSYLHKFSSLQASFNKNDLNLISEVNSYVQEKVKERQDIEKKLQNIKKDQEIINVKESIERVKKTVEDLFEDLYSFERKIKLNNDEFVGLHRRLIMLRKKLNPLIKKDNQKRADRRKQQQQEIIEQQSEKSKLRAFIKKNREKILDLAYELRMEKLSHSKSKRSKMSRTNFHGRLVLNADTVHQARLNLISNEVEQIVSQLSSLTTEIEFLKVRKSQCKLALHSTLKSILKSPEKFETCPSLIVDSLSNLNKLGHSLTVDLLSDSYFTDLERTCLIDQFLLKENDSPNTAKLVEKLKQELFKDIWTRWSKPTKFDSEGFKLLIRRIELFLNIKFSRDDIRNILGWDEFGRYRRIMRMYYIEI